MIDSIHIENFRKHTDTTITFDKGITCIAGNNQVGKSTVLEALLWVAENRPVGDDYISHSARSKKGKQIQPTIVTVTKGDQTCIRKKSEDFNGYILNGIEYTAIGMSVPDEVAKFFNISVENIQRQQTPPFLLNETGSEVSKYFNSIINLGVIDTATDMASGLVRKTKSSQKACEDNLYLCNSEISLLPDLNHLDELVKQIEQGTAEQRQLQDHCVQIERTLVLINDLFNQLTQIPDTELLHRRHTAVTQLTSEYEKLSLLVKTLSEMSVIQNSLTTDLILIPDSQMLLAKQKAVLELDNQVRSVCTDIQNLTRLCQEMVELQKSVSHTPLNQCSMQLAEINGLQTEKNKVVAEISGLSEKIGLVQALTLQKDRLGGVIVSPASITELQGIQSSIKTLLEMTQQITTLNSQLQLTTQEIAVLKTNLPKTCPTCGQPLQECVH